MEELIKYLEEIIKTSRKCAHCIYNHNGICFFAYDCIKCDFKYHDEGNM